MATGALVALFYGLVAMIGAISALVVCLQINKVTA
jgi:hypothetical protein